MAGLLKLRGKYYARVRTPVPGGRKDKLISLMTDNQRVAVIRRIEVEKEESNIKQGIEFIFPWQAQDGQKSVKRRALIDTVEDYLQARRNEHIRPGTFKIYRNALTLFQNAIGKRYPIEEVTSKQIDKFIQYTSKRGLKITTVNIDLRAIKTFLLWAQERGIIQKVPKIKQLNGAPNEPIYLSNAEFDRVCDQVDEYLARVFRFYRATGCRLREPLTGEIDGQFLTISADGAKTHRSRDIFLSYDNMATLREIRAKTHTFEIGYISKTRKTQVRKTNSVMFFSTQFRQAATKAGVTGKKFHSLRHTCAIRKYLETRDIYEVARQLGHANVTTSLIYTRFNSKKLGQDFPDLVTGEQANNYGKVATL